jgi:hypothetical protein
MRISAAKTNAGSKKYVTFKYGTVGGAANDASVLLSAFPR